MLKDMKEYGLTRTTESRNTGLGVRTATGKQAAGEEGMTRSDCPSKVSVSISYFLVIRLR
jgi:hypothetical protein